jgi:hypothetical protein
MTDTESIPQSRRRRGAKPRGLPRPDDLFIKVYPARLQALILRADLTRTELAELLMLALRMDDERTCFPALETLANDSGHKSRLWSRELVKRLKRKGVIDYDTQANQSHYFVLPDCFEFGDQTSDHQMKVTDRKSDQGGDRKSDRGGDQTSDQHGDQKSDHEADQQKQDQLISKTSKKISRHADSSNVVAATGPIPITNPDQLAVFYELHQAGVQPAESYLMAQQYRASTIRTAIQQSKAPQVLNRGAYIRSAVVKKAAIEINYPKGTREQLNAAAAMSLVNAMADRAVAPNPYLADEYFRRRAADETASDLDQPNVYDE